MSESEMTPTDAATPAPSPLRWYVVHAYSGMEKAVERNLRERIDRAGMDSKFGRILVPTEEVVELKNGKKAVTERRFFPGYVLVEMLMDEILAEEERAKFNKFHDIFPDETHEVVGTVIHSRHLYPKHMEFFAAGLTYRQRLFLAANRVGIAGSGFEGDDNLLVVHDAAGSHRLGPDSKSAVATALVTLIAGRLAQEMP